MSHTKPTTKKTAKRSKPAKFMNDAGLPPLRDDEYIDLSTKMERLDAANHTLIAASQDVDQRRSELLEAETTLKDSEANLRAVKEEHQVAMREIAPLLNRLPTV